MQEGYDRHRIAALFKEAQKLTDHLKTEAVGLERQLARVLEGDEDEPLTGLEGTATANVAEHKTVGRSFWRFWR